MHGRRVLLTIGSLLLILGLVGLAGVMLQVGPCMPGWGCGFYLFGWVIVLLFWAFLIGGVALLAIWLIREVAPAVAHPAGTSRALEILKERYARGEITREQYEEMRRVLETLDDDARTR